ncbi:uncharacterized protein LOC122387757 [Amphibalanus amphitrite]|uniref:uncharacterized protein LOC122387210 n=1 Tax=Amphibalanus amphitrite TaxID=1232801 RepID=UPI001C90BB41|nr:uncharacterized protein LOC122387210 [Amphibalanus amphitrite]XP_043234141.1 uncharacterized protein LOC122387757 [Amphibalanus amphitrite]
MKRRRDSPSNSSGPSQSLLSGDFERDNDQDCVDCAVLRKEKCAMDEECTALKLRIGSLEGQVKALKAGMLAVGDLPQLMERFETTVVWLAELKASKPRSADARPGIRDSESIELGPGGTRLSLATYRSIPWKHPNKNKTVREILVSVFGMEVLAKSSMTGKPSNAMSLNKPAKRPLDRVKLDDVIHACKRKLGMSTGEVQKQVTAVCNNCAKVRSRAGSTRQGAL